MVEGQPFTTDINQITTTVEFDNKCSAHPGSRKVQEMTNLHHESAGEALEKLRGFSWRYVGARSP